MPSITPDLRIAGPRSAGTLLAVPADGGRRAWLRAAAPGSAAAASRNRARAWRLRSPASPRRSAAVRPYEIEAVLVARLLDLRHRRLGARRRARRAQPCGVHRNARLRRPRRQRRFVRHFQHRRLGAAVGIGGADGIGRRGIGGVGIDGAAGFDFERSQSSGPGAGSLAVAGKRGSGARGGSGILGSGILGSGIRGGGSGIRGGSASGRCSACAAARRPAAGRIRRSTAAAAERPHPAWAAAARVGTGDGGATGVMRAEGGTSASTDSAARPSRPGAPFNAALIRRSWPYTAASPIRISPVADRDAAGNDQRVAQTERIIRNAKSNRHEATGSGQQAHDEQNDSHLVSVP